MGAVALCHCRGKIIKKPKDLGRACYAGAGAGASRYSHSSHWNHLVPILRDGEPTASGCPPFCSTRPTGLPEHSPPRPERRTWVLSQRHADGPRSPAVQGQGKDCRDVLERCYGSESRFQPRPVCSAQSRRSLGPLLVIIASDRKMCPFGHGDRCGCGAGALLEQDAKADCMSSSRQSAVRARA